MRLYTKSGWLDAPHIEEIADRNNINFILIIGKRQIGKTYNVLKLMLDTDKRFILLRSVTSEVEMLKHNVASPFEKIKGYENRIFFESETQYTAKITRLDTEKIKDGETGEEVETDRNINIGLLASLSSIGRIRGFNGDIYTDVVYDEFIPESHLLKVRHGDDAFNNMYTTIDGNSFTLTSSATVSAYTKIDNGDVTFTSKIDSKDIYVLNAIKAKKLIEVTAGDVVVDEEASATSTTGEVYKVENGAISADKMDFFVKNLEFGVVKDPAYQVDGKEAYIKMNNTNITFLVAAGDSVNVKVITSKNSCKTLNAENDESVTTDRKNYVNVSGKTYGNEDVTAEGGNIIEFGLAGKKQVKTKDADGNDITVDEDADIIYTFQKYSGTGNILISSIEITPATAAPAEDVVVWVNQAPEANGATNWNGTYRFGLEGNDGNNECIATFPADVWNKIKTETFCMQYRPADPTNYMIRTTTGWWSVQWLGADNDIAPWQNAERIIEDGDGLYHIEVNFGTDPILEQLDAQHLLFTGVGYTPMKLYFPATTAIKGITVQKDNNGAIYNLSGQKVDESYRGVVIRNGKKMLQK